MPVDFDIVVSSENTHYMGWQTLLFCFSAVTRLGKCPAVIVHRTDAPLRAEFLELEKWGCRVIEAPSYRAHPLRDFPPRNEPGSLLTITSGYRFKTNHLLFCEADMLFTAPPRYVGGLCGELYQYMDYAERRIRDVAAGIGLSNSIDKLNQEYLIGVPYLIPIRLLSRIAPRWIEILDSFKEVRWIDIMYAFGLAAMVEGVRPTTTHLMVDNYDQLRRVRSFVIHYCYGDIRWDKRSYRNGQNPFDAAPETLPKPANNTVLGQIKKQISQANAYRGGSHVFRALRRTVWRTSARSRALFIGTDGQ